MTHCHTVPMSFYQAYPQISPRIFDDAIWFYSTCCEFYWILTQYESSLALFMGFSFSDWDGIIQSFHRITPLAQSWEKGLKSYGIQYLCTKYRTNYLTDTRMSPLYTREWTSISGFRWHIYLSSRIDILDRITGAPSSRMGLYIAFFKKLIQ